MGEAANVQSLQALDDLKASLARFAGEAQEVLSAAAQEIQRTLDWLTERHNYWQAEVRRRQQAVAQARLALATCETAASAASRSDVAATVVCAPFAEALRRAEARLREAEAELRNVQQWTRQVQQAITDYMRQGQRLVAMLNSDLPKAQAFLGRKRNDLERYQGVSITTAGIGASIPSQSVMRTPEAAQGIAWAEKRAILKRMDDGHSITMEDVQKLMQPISDLQAGTLEEDRSWLGQILESERYLEAMRDSQEAEDLRDALLATLKALNYQRSK